VGDAVLARVQLVDDKCLAVYEELGKDLAGAEPAGKGGLESTHGLLLISPGIQPSRRPPRLLAY